MFRLTRITTVFGTALLAGTFQVALAQTTGATTTRGLDQATTSVGGNLQKSPDAPRKRKGRSGLNGRKK